MPIVVADRRFRLPKLSPADFGLAERWQHSGHTLEPTEEAGIVAARATEEHIVDQLLLRRLIGKNESEAAFKFKLDYHRAGIEARAHQPLQSDVQHARFFRRA
jgi:hypothetical protein